MPDGLILDAHTDRLARAYADVFNAGKMIETPKTWIDAFDLLRKRAREKNPDEKFIIFLDELPWLASPQSRFLAALEHAWNRYLSRERNLLLIVCGSAAAWMIRKVLYDRGGLHGRLTQTLRMLPFTLTETRLFLEEQQVKLPTSQIIELYLAVGGVAKYLLNLQPGQSAQQITQGRYFDRNAPLKGEFHKLFRSLFDNYERHLTVIETLARSRYGLTAEQLLEETQIQSGGSFTDLLSELQHSGFITFLRQFGNKKKAGKYLLTDEFTLFYLKWAREWEHELDSMPGHWQRQANTQSFRAWAGYAFETLCVKNIDNIKHQLGISGVTTRVSQWRDNAAQIDLVIDRADNCINLCEIKFHNTTLTLKASDADDLIRKKERFFQSTGTRKALVTTLISVNGVVRNSHYIRAVDSVIQAEEFVG